MPRMGWQPCRGISGSFRLESVAGLLWNQWQLSCGTGGNFTVEAVAGFTWNRWQLWRGIRSMDWKYALRLAFPGLSFHFLVLAKLHKRLVAEEEEQVLLDAILEH